MKKSHVPVNSSNIINIAYDNDTQVLEVTFKNNRSYAYHKVPENVYDEFIAADSVGSYFARSIKDQYDTRPVPMAQGDQQQVKNHME